jgi:putative flippase GtrA
MLGSYVFNPVWVFEARGCGRGHDVLRGVENLCTE